jgi:fused signal recognition particle receptor
MKAEISAILSKGNTDLNIERGKQNVILVVGVNGAGKTTTIGKLAHRFKKRRYSVLLAAGDTFRAAAIDQLVVWGERVGVDVIRHQEGSDPGAVAFDACKAATNRNEDILIIDTAGRLHNKANLMEELRKVGRIVRREMADANIEILLVLDATTGQNAISQARIFGEVVDVTGISLAKLDGTAKGGVIIGICDELNIPVKLIGIGEGIEDLKDFIPEEFVNALFEQGE